MQFRVASKKPAPAIRLGGRPGAARRRRQASLPTLVPTTRVGRYLHRLAWLFGGSRL
jgi:hypothetical protein